MKTKNKSFLEDTFIIVIICVLIYAIYSFFFSSNEIEKSAEAKIVTEEKVENSLLKETIDSKLKNDETIFENENAKINEEEINPLLEQKETEVMKTKGVDAKISEEFESKKLSKKEDNLSLFYKSIEDQINKKLEKTPAENGTFINIRITILKDGKFEQLILVDGNKNYFDKVKSSISKVFPVKIEDDLKENFPRYFRMEIGVK